MKNDEKNEIFIFLEKVSERLEKAPEGLWRAPEGLSKFFRAWKAIAKIYKKVHEECFAQHVDGAPSTAQRFCELFRLEKSAGRRKIRSRPNNDSS